MNAFLDQTFERAAKLLNGATDPAKVSAPGFYTPESVRNTLSGPWRDALLKLIEDASDAARAARDVLERNGLGPHEMRKALDALTLPKPPPSPLEMALRERSQQDARKPFPPHLDMHEALAADLENRLRIAGYKIVKDV